VGRCLGEQCGAGGAQVIALGVGVDRQRHRRVVAVPGRDDLQWHAAGQHKADAGIAEALEVDAAQAGVLTQALEFVGVPLMADGGAVLAYRDQTVIGPARAESLCFGLLAGLELIQCAGQLCGQWEVAAASPRLRHALIGFLADSECHGDVSRL
jgi:hypothetical protein